MRLSRSLATGVLAAAGVAAWAPPTSGAAPQAGAAAGPKAAPDAQRSEVATPPGSADTKATADGGGTRADALSGQALALLRAGRNAEAAEAALQAIAAARQPDSPPAGLARSVLCRVRRADASTAAGPSAPESLKPWFKPDGGMIVDSDHPLTIDKGKVSVYPRHVDAEVVKPRPAFNPRPDYTEAARQHRLMGVVIVEAVIDEHGCVTDSRILKGLPDGLDGAALTAVRDWAFLPATVLGQPVAVYYVLTLNFQLQGSKP
jgi:TonB family protein